MSEQDRSTLKGFFQTGQVPNQSEFEDLIDSFLNKTDESDRIVPAPISGDAGKISRIKGDESGWFNADLEVDTVASLRNINGSDYDDGTRIWINGYDSKNDGGQGVVYKDASDTTTTDDGGMVFVDADGVRWKRPFAWTMKVSWYGAKFDGATDDHAAMQSAADFLEGRYGHYIMPAGTAIISDGIEIPEGVKVIGQGIGTTIIKASGAFNNVGAVMGVKNYSSTIGEAKGNVFKYFTIDGNEETDNFGGDNRLNGLLITYASDFKVDHVEVKDGTGYGIWIQKSFDGVVTDCIASNYEECIEVSQDTDNIHIVRPRITGADGKTITNILFYGNCDNSTVTKAVIDGYGHGIDFSSSSGGCNNCIAENCIVSVKDVGAAAKNALRFGGSTGDNENKAIGGYYYSESSDAIDISGADGTRLSDLKADGRKKAVTGASATNTEIYDVRAVSRVQAGEQGAGIEMLTSCDNTTVSGGRVTMPAGLNLNSIVSLSLQGDDCDVKGVTLENGRVDIDSLNGTFHSNTVRSGWFRAQNNNISVIGNTWDDTTQVDDNGTGNVFESNIYIPVSNFVAPNVKTVARRSSAFSCPNATWVAVPLDSLVEDELGIYDATNDRITISGNINQIKIKANIEFSGNGTGVRAVSISKNGNDPTTGARAQYPIQTFPASSAIGNYGYIETGIIDVSDGDYFELEAWQNSGGNLNVGTWHTWLEVERIN